MFCLQCGKEIPEGSKFCNFCGEAIEDSHKKKQKIRNRPTLIIFMLCIIVVIVLAVLFLMKPKGPTNDMIMDEYYDYAYPRAKNPVIIGKAVCDKLSVEAKSYGITEAWLVTMDDDWINYPHPNLWIKIDGQWIRTYENNCP